MSERRTVVAFLVAPLAVPLIMVLSVLEAVRLSAEELVAGLATTVLLYSLVGYAGTLLFGWPLYRLLLKFNLVAFGIAPVAGFVVGAAFAILVFLALVSIGVPPSDWFNSRSLAWAGGLCGAPVGILFWLIARPDRQTLPESPTDDDGR